VIAFLVLWVVTFASLAITLGLLSWIYNTRGGDLGLTNWRRETIIAVVISLLQALLLWLPLSLTGHPVAVGRMFPVASAVLMLSYKITHLSSDLLEGTYEMENSSIIAIAAVQFAMLFGIGMLPAILSNAK
jgi:hypothetical protein